MVTKKPARRPAPPPDETARREREREDDARPGARVDSDVERNGDNAPAGPAGVETLDPATPRVDIEHGGLADAGDIERGSG